MLAHAAVGCVQGALSSGNCGKGAFAAAVSDAVMLSGIIKPTAVGEWGSWKGAAESGFVGGIASRLVGGSFVDGFSVAAAGYLLTSSTAGRPSVVRLGIAGNLPVAFVGGADDIDMQPMYEKYKAFIWDNPRIPAAYFEWDQGAALGNWIDANNNDVVVIGHSWGGNTAAAVVAAGHNVAMLITIDPVSYVHPDFQAVKANSSVWYDFSATGDGYFSGSNVIAALGHQWGNSPSNYVTGRVVPGAQSHAAAVCVLAPHGC